MQTELDELLARLALRLDDFVQLAVVVSSLLAQLRVLDLLGAVRVVDLIELGDMLGRLALELVEQRLDPALVPARLVHRLQHPVLVLLELELRVLQLLRQKLVLRLQRLDLAVAFTFEELELVHVLRLLVRQLLLEDVHLRLQVKVVLLLLLFAAVQGLSLELEVLELLSHDLDLLFHLLLLCFEVDVLRSTHTHRHTV